MSEQKLRDQNQVTEALFEHIEAGKSEAQCYREIAKRLHEDLVSQAGHRKEIEAIAKQLKTMHDGDTDYDHYTWLEFTGRVRLLNEVAQAVTLEALEIKAKAEALRAEPVHSRAEFLKRRTECMKLISEIDDIQQLLRRLSTENGDALDALLKFISDPEQQEALVERAAELYDE